MRQWKIDAFCRFGMVPARSILNKPRMYRCFLYCRQNRYYEFIGSGGPAGRPGSDRTADASARIIKVITIGRGKVLSFRDRDRTLAGNNLFWGAAAMLLLPGVDRLIHRAVSPSLATAVAVAAATGIITFNLLPALLTMILTDARATLNNSD